MASTYVNNLRLNEMGTGDASGTWGTTTNTNLELIGEALGFGTEAITTNADTHSTVVADGASDAGRAMYLKYTGTLDSACTITITPNTMKRMQFIENGTSGSQNIIISQGSGANITIPPGDVKAVYLDGAGSGAAVVDAFASLNVVDLKVQDDLTVTDDLIVNGDIDLEGSIDVNGTANLDVVDIDGAVDMATTLTLAGNADFNGDLDVDGTTNLDVVDIDGATTISSQIFSQLAGNTTTGGNIQLGITTDDTAKYTAITAQQHNSGTETEGFTLIGGNSAAADTNLVNIGGGFGEQNPATSLSFFTGSAATREGTVKATIISSGNFGIGTTTPTAKLHVHTSGAEGINIGLQNSERYWNMETDGGLLMVKDVTAGGLTRMAFDTSGNVGINETSPDSKLHVTGEIRAQDSRGGSLAAVILNGGSSSTFPKVEVDASNPLTFVTNTTERARFAGTTGYFQAGVTTGGKKNSQIVAGAGIFSTDAAITSTNGTVDVTVPSGGIMIAAQSGYVEDAAIFTFKADGGSQGVFGTGIGNSNWAFGTTSEPGGGQRNKVWVQTTNTLRFKDNGYGARTYQLTILSNTN